MICGIGTSIEGDYLSIAVVVSVLYGDNSAMRNPRILPLA